MQKLQEEQNIITVFIKKMERLNVAFHDLYDITAVRVIVDTEKECYEVLGLIHSQFKPIRDVLKTTLQCQKATCINHYTHL